MINEQNLKEDIKNLIHNNIISKNNVYSLVFLGYLIKKYSIVIDVNFDTFLIFIHHVKEEISSRSYSQDELSILTKCLNNLITDFNSNNNGITQLINFINKYSKELYLEFIRINLEDNIEKYSKNIPVELSNLVLKILNTKKEGRLADLICENGNFLINATDTKSDISVLGLTDNSNSLLDTEIRLYMSNVNYQLDYENETTIKKSFSSYDSIFCLLPQNIKDKEIYYNNFTNTKNNSMLWKYIDNSISMLNAKGKAVFILSNDPLFKNTDLEYRKYLIENKLVETIIELPNNIFYHTKSNAIMLVLNKNRNSMVSMINATDMILEKTSNINRLDITKIYNTYINNENKFSDLIIKDKDYSFIPSNYLNDIKRTMSNPVKLKDYVEVIRGFRGNKKNINNDKTIKIIQVSNLTKSFINVKDLEKINFNVKDKDLLKDEDLLIARTSSNFKCTLLHLKENEKVIATENVIILRVKNPSALSPYYLKEYLNSKKGINLIFNNQLKTSHFTIQINKLNDLYIDLLPINKQIEIEKLSLYSYEEKIKYKNKIDSINNKIKKILNDK